MDESGEMAFYDGNMNLEWQTRCQKFNRVQCLVATSKIMVLQPHLLMRELCGLETLKLQLVWHDDIHDWLEYTKNQWQNSAIDDRLLIDMAGNAICGSMLAGCFLAILQTSTYQSC